MSTLDLALFRMGHIIDIIVGAEASSNDCHRQSKLIGILELFRLRSNLKLPPECAFNAVLNNWFSYDL